MSCIEGCRGLSYGLAFSQLAVAIGSVMFTPTLQGTLVTFAPTLVNGTVVPALSSPPVDVPVSAILLTLSALMALFAQYTLEADGRDMLSDSRDYSQESLLELGPWDAIFRIMVAVRQSLIVVYACAPLDIYAFLFASALLTYFTCRGIAPRDRSHRDSLSGLGYAGGMLAALLNVPHADPRGVYVLLVSAVFDYVLSIGHNSDASTTMQTVTNCRMTYVNLNAALVCVAYVAIARR